MAPLVVRLAGGGLRGSRSVMLDMFPIMPHRRISHDVARSVDADKIEQLGRLTKYLRPLKLCDDD